MMQNASVGLLVAIITPVSGWSDQAGGTDVLLQVAGMWLFVYLAMKVGNHLQARSQEQREPLPMIRIHAAVGLEKIGNRGRTTFLRSRIQGIWCKRLEECRAELCKPLCTWPCRPFGSAHMRSREAWLLIVTAVVYPLVAAADIYRCEIDGKITFRDRPCPQAAEQAVIEKGSPGIPMGCYVMDAQVFWGRPTTLVLRVERGADTAFGVSILEQEGTPKDKVDSIGMRLAAPTELRRASGFLKAPVSRGIVMSAASGWPASTETQLPLPLGVYQTEDAYRDRIYYAYLGLAKGLARPADCPAP